MSFRSAQFSGLKLRAALPVSLLVLILPAAAVRPTSILAQESKPAEARPPVSVENGQAKLDLPDFRQDAATGAYRVEIEDAPLSPNRRKQPPVLGHGEAGELVRRWFDEGTAAGHRGDFYDNRDRGHSLLNVKQFPHLSRIVYSDSARKRGLDYALQFFYTTNQVVLGNSSTAMVGSDFWRSNTRRAMVMPQAMQMLYRQYGSNHLYIYPEHRDHDPGHNGIGNGYGDVFPANIPYVITSQGSSGSDRAFMDAVACTLAAFQPETKRRLVATGLLTPTVQMIVRSTGKQLDRAEQYLSGKAHPTVFEGGNVDVVKMVRLAHSIEPDSIPPLVRLEVVDEDQPVVGRDYFTPGPAEKLFDTPSAIARVWRSTRYERRIVVSARRSIDANQRPLTYHWVVLRGKRRQIEIEPVDSAGSIVEIRIPYHGRRRVRGTKIESNRVDIGAFVHNGKHYSAPALISYFNADSEGRTYDAEGRILEVDYNYGDAHVDRGRKIRDATASGAGLPNWTGLLRLAAGAEDTFAARLLRGEFSPQELAELRKALQELEEKIARQQELEQAYREISEKLEAGEGNQAKLKEQRGKVQYRLDKAEGEAAGVINGERAALSGSVQTRLLEPLEKILHKVDFTIEHQATLEPLIEAAPAGRRKRYLALRQPLIEIGILRRDEQGKFHRETALDPPGDFQLDISKYEAKRLKRLNLHLMQHILYPDLVHPWFRRYYVDPLVVVPNYWRDVYHYDEQGRMLGWTRYQKTDREEFTRHGAVVVRADAAGRPLVARTVRYEITGEKANRRIVQKPGGELLHYRYASQDDRLGSIARQEPAEP